MCDKNKEKIKKSTNTAQYERLVNLLSTKKDIAQNLTRRPLEEVKCFWDNVANEVNSLGPPTRDASDWKKVWSDFKSYIKKKLASNKKENNATGGGPFKQKLFTSLEETVISLVNLKDSVEGIGSRTFGVPTESCYNMHAQGTNSVTDPGTSVKLLSSRPVTSPKPISENKNNNENEVYDSANSGEQNRKRKRPMTSLQLLQKQVKMQETYFNDVVKLSQSVGRNCEEVACNLKKVYRSVDKLCDIQKHQLQEMREHNKEMRKLQERKVELKKRILEIELMKLEQISQN